MSALVGKAKNTFWSINYNIIYSKNSFFWVTVIALTALSFSTRYFIFSLTRDILTLWRFAGKSWINFKVIRVFHAPNSSWFRTIHDYIRTSNETELEFWASTALLSLTLMRYLPINFSAYLIVLIKELVAVFMLALPIGIALFVIIKIFNLIMSILFPSHAPIQKELAPLIPVMRKLISTIKEDERESSKSLIYVTSMISLELTINSNLAPILDAIKKECLEREFSTLAQIYKNFKDKEKFKKFLWEMGPEGTDIIKIFEKLKISKSDEKKFTELNNAVGDVVTLILKKEFWKDFLQLTYQ